MRVPVVSIIVVSIAVGLSIPVLADRKQAKEEQVCVNELKALIETESIETDLVVESKEELKKELCPQESVYESQYNFDTLREENKDIIAWINIPGTNVDYPVLFDGTDEYLHKNLGGEDSASGCIYVDATTKNVLDDEINIIYGHNMKNGTMFADVDQFSEKECWNEHQDVDVYLEDREIRMTVVASVVGACDAKLRSIDTIEKLKDFCNDKSITNGTIPGEWEQMYVLVTCNYMGDNFRTYLFCKRK